MGRRSGFPRNKHDLYDTPALAVVRLLPLLQAEGIKSFASPCDGNGCLRRHLVSVGLDCVYHGDIRQGQDALAETGFGGANAIIENPPWSRPLLHRLIEHFIDSVPVVWLLFDANWVWTQQSAPLIGRCTHVVPVHRLKWIPGSRNTAKDDSCWYRFQRDHTKGPRIVGWGTKAVSRSLPHRDHPGAVPSLPGALTHPHPSNALHPLSNGVSAREDGMAKIIMRLVGGLTAEDGR